MNVLALVELIRQTSPRQDELVNALLQAAAQLNIPIEQALEALNSDRGLVIYEP